MLFLSLSRVLLLQNPFFTMCRLSSSCVFSQEQGYRTSVEFWISQFSVQL